MLAGLKAGVMLFVRQQESCWPVIGLMTAVKVMVVAKLPRLKRFRLEAALPPLTIVIESGTAKMLKS
jgi:hypothetical protein